MIYDLNAVIEQRTLEVIKGFFERYGEQLQNVLPLEQINNEC